MLVRTQSRDSLEKIKPNPPKTWHYTFAKRLPHTKQNQWLMPPRLTRTVEDGSNGEKVERPRWTKRTEKGLRRRQRALARCKRGSKRRARRKIVLAKYHAYIAALRSDHLHKESRKLVNRFGRIAAEDLNIKGLARGMLAKHVNDASWATLIAMLTYKAERAGCRLIKVDPRGTMLFPV